MRNPYKISAFPTQLVLFDSNSLKHTARTRQAKDSGTVLLLVGSNKDQWQTALEQLTMDVSNGAFEHNSAAVGVMFGKLVQTQVQYGPLCRQFEYTDIDLSVCPYLCICEEEWREAVGVGGGVQGWA